MIDSISGKIVAVKESVITLSSGPFGFSVSIAKPYEFTVGNQATIFISMQWNSEQGPSFFGFSTELERSVFQLIISCSGVGPKIALSILTSMSPVEFIKAIQTADEKAISKVNGIGAKKAEQMIVQLRHKVEKLVNSVTLPKEEGLEQWKNVSEVLQSLNYSKAETSTALDYLRKNIESDVSFDQLVRKALSFLSKKV